MSKFKVGDRCEVIDTGDHYGTYEEWVTKNASKFYDEWKCGRHYDRCLTPSGLKGRVVACAPHCDYNQEICLVRADDKSLFLIAAGGLKKINDQKIIITHDNRTTLARMYEGNKLIKSAEAKCSPNDTFDFTTGAKMAFERLVEEKKQPKQDKPEPVKLYCVKDYEPGIGVTKGKIYEFDKHGRIEYDDGAKLNPHDSWDDYKKRNNRLADCLVPLISRPAKVGEWVYISKAIGLHGELYRTGEIHKVTSSEFNKGYAHFECGGEGCYASEYLVLDGYQPEPEYYSGKVVCVKKNNEFLTAGKVYEFKNGISKDDNGQPFPYFGKLESIDELNARICSDFIPFIG